MHWLGVIGSRRRTDREAIKADEVLAFAAPDRKGGTEHTIRCAERLGRRRAVNGRPGASPEPSCRDNSMLASDALV